jgi:hypothetical protein
MEIVFQNEKHVLQIFYHRLTYSKDERRLRNRSDQMYQWSKSIQSANGMVRNDVLFLAGSEVERYKLDQNDLLILTDYHQDFSTNEQALLEQEGYLDTKGKLVDRHFLNFKQNEDTYGILRFKQAESLEVHLNYSYFGVGLPKRDNFKLAELRDNKGIRIRINGKMDFSATSRRERTYKEHDIFIWYYGRFNSFTPCTLDQHQPLSKSLQVNDYKLIDLRKTLY